MYLGLGITQNILKHTYVAYRDPFFCLPIRVQVFITWVSAFVAYYGIELACYLCALLAVILGLCTPAD